MNNFDKKFKDFSKPGLKIPESWFYRNLYYNGVLDVEYSINYLDKLDVKEINLKDDEIAVIEIRNDL